MLQIYCFSVKVSTGAAFGNDPTYRGYEQEVYTGDVCASRQLGWDVQVPWCRRRLFSRHVS